MINSIKYISKVGISVTQNAWRKMEDITKFSSNKLGFIYSVSSGGCNGFNFELNLLDTKKHSKLINNNKIKPILLTNNNTNLYIEPSSEIYLLGTTIDYITEDYTNGNFENKFVFNVDKKMATTCGCGVSFSPRNI
jgi:iron-sulfur cluster assembly accessory protein